ncbi:MarR family transcriptional regulator [Streptomyces alkaliphilus]|uniref:MarR family transcriptional regulator n=1 Tax=Streptomyces alkaliphilus TaxID=1472722 RepID=UPI00117F4D70|nr:MarR family transcriptional regulator [Streptomyces alkaliphilus]MQS06127.1 MarR family transcriptional regulator [Streptomyces alkaliphilus]
MPQLGPDRREAVDRTTGEILQLELLESDSDQSRTKPPIRYDWSPPGRHVNVGKRLMSMVWHKESGYDQNDRDVLGFFIAHAPEGTEPLRLTFKEISEILGLRRDTVSRSVGRLHLGGLLLETEKVGRIRFFRINPRAAFDGSAGAQVQATIEARHPVVPAPAPPARKAPARPAGRRRKAS